MSIAGARSRVHSLARTSRRLRAVLRLRRKVRRARSLLRSRGRARSLITPWRVVYVAMVVAWTAYFSWISLQVHHGLGTSSYDLGLYDQGVWLLSRFKAPFVTLMGRNLMGDHTSFILVLLAPLYWVWPSVGVLLGSQSLLVALGSLPVFLYARERLGRESVAVAMAAVYLLHPAVGWTNREGFHPDAFLGFFVGMAIYGALQRRWRIYVVFVVLSLLVKEDVSLVLVPLGVWVAVKRDRRIGLLTIGGSLAFMAVAMLVVMRSLIGVPTRNGWRIPFGGPGGLLAEAVERPGNVVDHLRSEGRPFYLWQMTFPVAWLFARAPSVALISAVVLLSNVVSTFWYQFHIEYHYSLVAVPALVLGSVYAISHVSRRARRWAVAGLLVSSVWSTMMWGAVPLGEVLCLPKRAVGAQCDALGREVSGYWTPEHPSPVAARELFALIPDDAVVSAYHALDPHLSHRRYIYQFPNPFRVVLYGTDTTLEEQRARLPIADRVDFVMLPVNKDGEVQADWDREAHLFELVKANDYWELYRRR